MFENRPEIPLAEQFEAALDWWRDAGVDCDFSDEIEPLLKEQVAESARPAAGKVETTPEKAREPAITAATVPSDLEGFQNWWVAPDSPIPAGPGPRLAPRGNVGAKLMLLTPMPEAEDRDALLSGPQGVMLANIARALSIAPEQTYFASALPAHMTLPDWDGLHAEGLGTALTRHVELAKPERVILFGSKLPMLLGHDPSSPPELFNEIAGVPALATFAPDRLLDHKRQRARLWQRLLDWTAA